MHYGTKGAISSANIAQYHKSGSTFGKTFWTVGTTGTFANSMQLEVTGELSHWS